MLTNDRPQVSQEESICQERIRQAKLAFNLSVALVGASAVITFVGIILLLAGCISQGAYTALGGLTSTAVNSLYGQLSREANERLDRIAKELDNKTKFE